MENIILHEVGLRDGLQMEKETVPFETKIKWIDNLIESGTDIIQLGSFVHPVKAPQMADTDKLFEYYMQPGKKPDKVIMSGLALNERGVERALACGTEMICVGVSASETHSKKNTGMSTMEAVERIIKMARKAIAEGRQVQASVQSAFGCGFEGKIDEGRVLDIVKRYLDAGITKISLADTAGHANPAQVERMFGAVSDLSKEVETACHFHNTYGMGLANCIAALKSGVKYFETAFAGLGGCPFTKVAAGNVCTEDLVHMFQAMDLRKDINIGLLINIAKEVSGYFNRELPGFVYKTGPISGRN